MRKKTWITNSDLPERQEYQVMKRKPRTDLVGVKIAGQEHRFGQGGMFKVRDAGIAHEIHDRIGQGGSGDVLVIPTETKPTPGHTRTFVVPALPWHKE